MHNGLDKEGRVGRETKKYTWTEDSKQNYFEIPHLLTSQNLMITNGNTILLTIFTFTESCRALQVVTHTLNHTLRC